jgi:hypothetical protein
MKTNKDLFEIKNSITLLRLYDDKLSDAIRLEIINELIIQIKNNMLGRK